MALSHNDYEVLARVDGNYPQLKELLKSWLQEELEALPKASQDQVQKFQGRCLLLQELLSSFDFAPGIAAKRMVAQPKFNSTP